MFYSGQGFQLGGSSEAKTLSHPSSDDLKTGDSAEVHNIHNITKYDCAQRSITMKKNKLFPVLVLVERAAWFSSGKTKHSWW